MRNTRKNRNDGENAKNQKKLRNRKREQDYLSFFLGKKDI